MTEKLRIFFSQEKDVIMRTIIESGGKHGGVYITTGPDLKFQVV